MKTFASMFVLLLSLFFISCSKPEDLQIKQPTSTPIVEISTELFGMWDVTGEMLNFRLYENGLVEFDTIDKTRKDPQKTRHTTEELKITKQIYISESETEKIINLLTSEDFLKLEKTYTAKRAGTDIAINNTIVFQYENKEKTIKILSHLEDLSNPNLENFPDFPPVLSDLCKQINKIKSQSPTK